MVVEAGDALKHGARIIHFGGRAVLPECLVVCKPQLRVLNRAAKGTIRGAGGGRTLNCPV